MLWYALMVKFIDLDDWQNERTYAPVIAFAETLEIMLEQGCDCTTYAVADKYLSNYHEDRTADNVINNMVDIGQNSLVFMRVRTAEGYRDCVLNDIQKGNIMPCVKAEYFQEAIALCRGHRRECLIMCLDKSDLDPVQYVQLLL
jgi:hypothetical protein